MNVAIVVSERRTRSSHASLFLSFRAFEGAAYNGTLRAEDRWITEIRPSSWVYRALNAINYIWQVGVCLSLGHWSWRDVAFSFRGSCIR